MNKTTSIMTVIYELLDEIIGGILPGVYFCTYFLMCALAIFGESVLTLNSNNVYLIGIPFLSISYVLGTLFKRGSSELTDKKSVIYILKKTKYNIKNSEFMLNLDDNYFDKVLPEELNKLKNDYNVKFHLSYIQNQKRIWQIEKEPKHKIMFYILRKTKRKCYSTNIICMLLNPLNKLSNNKFKRLEKLISKRDALKSFYKDLNDKINFKVDYPYTHLKQYLENNGMSDLAQRVEWESSDGRRTKAFTNNILTYLTENNYPGMKQIKKREAHIRFMNSTYHSQRILFRCTSVIFVGIFLLFIIRFLLLWHLDFESEPIIFNERGKIVFTLHKLFAYVNRIVPFEGLFTIMCISAVYTVFYMVTRSLVLGNYHYQRLHEIVYMLQAQEHLEATKLSATTQSSMLSKTKL